MIYLDNAATTFIHPEVVDVIKNSLIDTKGNISSVHDLGFEATKEWNQTKDAIAEILNTSKKHLLFNSSGTEANNIVIQGRYYQTPKMRFITTQTEHSSVLNTFKAIEARGADVIYLGVDKTGFIDLNALEEALQEAPTSLVSILHTNNETGVIQDVSAITQLAHQYGALVHYDMVQVLIHNSVDLTALNADFATFSAHKFFGPKGIGLTYVKDHATLKPHTTGGSQEYRLRAGTQNVSLAKGFLKALEITEHHRAEWKKNIDHLAETFLKKLDASSLTYQLNGPSLDGSRIHGTLNIALDGVDASDLRFFLNAQEVYLSLGSACDSDRIQASHVLRAMYDDDARIDGSFRISFSPAITPKDLDQFVQLIEMYKKSA